jgi:hypothetical protein
MNKPSSDLDEAGEAGSESSSPTMLRRA